MGRRYEGKTPLKNDRQERFCQEYIIDLNASAAARRAGYSEKTAYSIGQRLLKKVEAQKRVAHLKAQVAERNKITQDMIIKELRLIGFSDIKNHQDIDESGQIKVKTIDSMGEHSRVIQELSEDRVIKENPDGSQVTVHDKLKIKIYDKLKALKMLAAYKGIEIENSNINIKGGVNVRPQADLSMNKLIKSFEKLENNGDK
jgi:phage terminase small subunit